ncbi:hypothetical protein EFA69_03275 [Rufibacter immobilis]|uniref:Lipocalin-like domain-containing protein n=1 Tax=Rufibacter immobilis TaxID=1348778 RepID=A0A3M9N5T5_9BACT|nr:hypothetical protein [Rufibacter immobilis]RNI32358.1 hypothetical protein EFA69_03275 [Rufibacter immobilis]
MKITYTSLLFFILLSAFQCQHQEDIKPRSENNAIVTGKWQLEEYYMSIGGPGSWTKADPAQPSIIEFKANGDYISGKEDCSGQYSVANGQDIIITVSCSTGYVKQSELIGKIQPTGELTIVPTSPTCIEGCSYKYKRIK